MLAAAGLYAIQHHWPALKMDHDNAEYLGQRLSSMGCTLTKQVDTNMVWFDTKSLPKPFTMDQMEPFFKEQGIKVFNGDTTEGRLVIHHQTPRSVIHHFIHVFEKFINRL
jgi:threonine aldolase